MNNIHYTKHHPKYRYPIEISKINLTKSIVYVLEEVLGIFTSTICLILSASSVGIIACEIENATPPMKITNRK
jgi:hypothetical protein